MQDIKYKQFCKKIIKIQLKITYLIINCNENSSKIKNRHIEYNLTLNVFCPNFWGASLSFFYRMMFYNITLPLTGTDMGINLGSEDTRMS